ncbi:MAG: BMP family ABC transporter substrate-binding protein [Acidimicrobiales bacterium]
MTDDRPYRDWSPAALAEELAARENERNELAAELEMQEDLEVRVELMTELTTTDDVLDQLKDELADRTIPPSASPTYRSVVVTGDHEPVREDVPVPYRAEDRSRIAPRPAQVERARPRQAAPPARRLGPALLLGAAVLLALAAGAFLLSRTDSGDSDEIASQPDSPEAENSTVAEIAAVVGVLGGADVVVEQRGSTIFLSGSVSSVDLQQAIIGSAQAIAGELPVDSSALTVTETASPEPQDGPESDAEQRAFQSEIDRIIAATPIIFATGQTQLTELHQRVLNNVAATMTAYPGIPVSVVGYTDDVGSAEANQALSLARAESVRSYLVGQGVAEDALVIEAMGEEASTGSQELANLERRVEFRVADDGPAEVTPLRIAMIAPSDRQDLAFTQSMVDAIDRVAAERGNLEVIVEDNSFVPEEAAVTMRGFADQGYDLIIAHGSQYGLLVLELATEYPEVAFAWGTASDTFGLRNVYAYDAAAEEGGYVLGALSALLTDSGTLGVVGPIEVGDAERYINGYRVGAIAEAPATSVLVTYTGSFSDTSFAAEAATSHLNAGADVLTGTAQMVLGAVATLNGSDALWFGNQANQTPLAPELVAASQVYHWEVILQQIIADVDAGRTAGQSYTANLANGGLEIEYNPAVTLPDSARSRADDLAAAIAAGTVTVNTG